ncbi:hypothetical protein D3C80_1142470 [compost metagenome]
MGQAYFYREQATVLAHAAQVILVPAHLPGAATGKKRVALRYQPLNAGADQLTRFIAKQGIHLRIGHQNVAIVAQHQHAIGRRFDNAAVPRLGFTQCCLLGLQRLSLVLQLQSLGTHLVRLAASFQQQCLGGLAALHNGHGPGEDVQYLLQQQRLVQLQRAQTSHFQYPVEALSA